MVDASKLCRRLSRRLLTTCAVNKCVPPFLVIRSLGLGVPFLAAAHSTNALERGMQHMRKLGRVLKVFAGGTMITMGVAMMTGYLSSWSYWLLETLPLLATIG